MYFGGDEGRKEGNKARLENSSVFPSNQAGFSFITGVLYIYVCICICMYVCSGGGGDVYILCILNTVIKVVFISE